MSYVTGSDGRGEMKYGIENALVVSCSYIALMTVGTLSKPESLSEIPDGCHIYAICTRPRILATTAELISEEDGVSKFGFSIMRSDRKAYINPTCQIVMPQGVSPKIEDNGATVAFMSSDDEVISRMPTALLLSQIMPPPLHEDRSEEIDRMFLDLSVEYIGQAYGKDGGRNALDRLSSHETLQRILGELNDKEPHRQVWIIVFKFDECAAQTLFLPWEGTVSDQESVDHTVDVWLTPLPNDQLTTLTEGALIRYFRPPFNERYKDTFPRADHSSYELPYKLDVNSVGFEVGTTSIITRIGSSTIQAMWAHMGLFTLSDPSVRRAFMDIFETPPTYLYPLLKDRDQE